MVGDRANFLSIASVGPNDAGNYTCIAENSAGVDYYTAPLAIIGRVFYITAEDTKHRNFIWKMEHVMWHASYWHLFVSLSCFICTPTASCMIKLVPSDRRPPVLASEHRFF